MSARPRSAAPAGKPVGGLNTQANIAAPDDFYQELVDMHRDLSEQQSALVNAKLILLLANHVGDAEVLGEAMRAAREDVAPEAGENGSSKVEQGRENMTDRSTTSQSREPD